MEKGDGGHDAYLNTGGMHTVRVMTRSVTQPTNQFVQ